MARVVSLDYGLARIGLAISDESKIIVSFQKVLPTQKSMAQTIKLLQETLSPFSIEKIIVGLPLHLDGNTSPLAEEVKVFITLLQKEVPYPVLPWDERLTTRQAEKALDHLSRKKRSQVVDGVTASIILRNYLDFCDFLIK
jgi:putative Holliday junction resolvase